MVEDFKSGQTKMKAVLADFLMSAGMKLESVASYNHLGNNDGKNLNEAEQFRSKARVHACVGVPKGGWGLRAAHLCNCLSAN